MTPQLTEVRVLQVGYGGVGRRRAKLVQANARASVVGIADPSAEAREAAAAAFGVPTATDPVALLTELRPDAVIVSTPNADHVPMAVAALQAGAHVLVEKPLATSRAEAERLVVAAGDRVVKLGANHQVFPAVLALLDALETGRCGALRSARIVIGHGRHAELPGWFRDPARGGGGTLLDNGSHAVLLTDAILAVAGQGARSVSATLDWQSGVDVAAQARVIGDDGLAVDIDASWVRPGGYAFNVTVEGSDGTLRLLNPGEVTLDGVPLEVVERNSWAVDTADFIDAIVAGRPPAVGLPHALRCLTLLDGMYESARAGRSVTLGA